MANAKPAVVLTKYEEAVQKAKEIVGSTRLKILSGYWEIGKLAGNILQPEYGEHTIEKFAADINLENAAVYACLQFNKSYPTKEDLDRVADRGLSWSHVRALLSPKLDEKERENLEKKVAKEGWGVRELTDEVRKIVGKTKQPSVKTPDSPIAVFTKTTKLGEKMTEMVAIYFTAVKEMKKVKGESKEDVVLAEAEARETLKNLLETLKSLKLK